uniref:RNA-directed DNA polymerase n=1 Tax=Lygus hesperus TaxID=30085 RepID=A0A0K8TJV5_LYGHE
MPFGLCNAPATFQRAMNRLLHALVRKGRVRVYQDDVRVDAATFEEMLDWLRKVFLVCRTNGLQLNAKKCELFRRSIPYLGYVISAEGVQTDPTKIERVATWPTPTSAKEVHGFVQFCSYYRPFVPDFAQRAGPLYRVASGKEAFAWTQECALAFHDLKRALTNAPVLGHARPELPYILDVDASGTAVGAVLSQQQGEAEEETVLAYYSRCLSRPERNYCVTRKELLALKLALEHFRHYGLNSGTPILVRTDHASLQWLRNFKQPDGQMARWQEALASYNVTVEYRKGAEHGNADGLSRRPCLALGCTYCRRQEGKDDRHHEDVKRIRVEIEMAWEQEQSKDLEVSQVRGWLRKGEKPGWQDVAASGPTAKALWAMWDQLVLEDGVLKRQWENENGSERVVQVIVPRQCRQTVLQTVHNLGHFGARRMISELRRNFCWEGLQRDVRDFGKSCVACRAAGRTRGKRAPLQEYHVGVPFERVAVDVMGPFPESNHGNRYIVVAVDQFTKWPEAFPVPDQRAETVARGLGENLMSRFGVPRELHTDQGRNFEADVFGEVMRILGVHKTRTTALRPQSNGLAERFNRTLVEMLRKVTELHQKDWDEHLAWALLAYRTTGPSDYRFFTRYACLWENANSASRSDDRDGPRPSHCYNIHLGAAAETRRCPQCSPRGAREGSRRGEEKI